MARSTFITILRRNGFGFEEARSFTEHQNLIVYSRYSRKNELDHRIILGQSKHLVKGQQQTSTRFYISSLKDKILQTYAGLIRGHWQIENNLHWHLDMSFGDDQSQL